jgi:CBS domain-containing protein
MREKQVRPLPVIDPRGRLAGFISVSDIARWTEQQARAATDAEFTRLMASVCAFPAHPPIETARQKAR